MTDKEQTQGYINKQFFLFPGRQGFFLAFFIQLLPDIFKLSLVFVPVIFNTFQFSRLILNRLIAINCFPFPGGSTFFNFEIVLIKNLFQLEK